MSIYEKLSSELSLDNIYENMDYLVNQVGERLSGTPEMRKATEFICGKLQEYGVSAHIDHFPMYQSYPKEASLTVLAPVNKEIPARPCVPHPVYIAGRHRRRADLSGKRYL